MKRTFLLPLYIAMLLAACNQQQPVSQLKEINAALEKANLIIEDNNNVVYEEMAGNKKDPRALDRVLIWEPKALVIWRRAAESKKLIYSIKDALIKQSDSLRNQDPTIVKQIMNSDGIGERLFEKLISFKDSAACVFDSKEFVNSSYMVEELNNDSIFFYKNVLQIDVAEGSKADWLKASFDNCSSLLALMTLNKIEANVISTENYLVNYCNSKIVTNYCGYFNFRAIASLNSSVVRSGDTIMVTAGVGAFSDGMYPQIIINGTRIKLNRNKVAEYEFIATGNPGTYNMPVKIEYMDTDGSRQTASKNLRYTIADNK